jgi:ADP-ribose pyrophosphatase YjhB (NUDIX family)
MADKHIVTVFIRNNGTVLILRNSRKAAGKWAGVSGAMKEASPLSQAMKEIEGETGLKGFEVKFLKAGKAFAVQDRQLGVRLVVHPFLFQAMTPQNVHIDEQYMEFKWIKPAELELYETVPALPEALSRVL